MGLLAVATCACAAGDDPPGKEKDRPANRLAKETSPYLLLHAHNPVDWYPWGPEAFAKAKAENKPIFLSVGYSSCYWCHVMERESFMDAEIAKVLNEHFVCIKVDREERPDVDQIYMAALQAFGTGGWPMSMFLTPDGRPFFGGTYFPPRDREGIAGVPDDRHGSRQGLGQGPRRDREGRRRPDRDRPRGRLKAAARRAQGVPLARPRSSQGEAAARRAVRPRVRRVRLQPAERPTAQVPRAGEPGLPARSAPPRRPGCEATARAPAPLEMVPFTLDRMARGGIRDQLGGGYHRYATEPVLDRPALREDALRQRPARLGPPAGVRDHRRPALARTRPRRRSPSSRGP